MARKPRFSLGGEVHLVVQRVRPERVPLFRNEWAFEHYLQALTPLILPHQITVYAYALLSDRVYLLVQPQSDDAISHLLQAHARFFVSSMNRRFGWRGGLWLDRFSCAMVDPQWLLQVMRFIDISPAQAGLVSSAGVYRWSSYAEHIGQQSTSFLQFPQAYWELGRTAMEREQAYAKWCQEYVSRADLRYIEQVAIRNGVIGENPYIQMLEARTNKKLMPVKRGRPSKK